MADPVLIKIWELDEHTEIDDANIFPVVIDLGEDTYTVEYITFANLLPNLIIDTDRLDTNAVSNAKFRQSAGLSVIGRAANTLGDVADITAASDDYVLIRDGTALKFGQLKIGSLGDNIVTDVKIRQSAALSVIGRASNSSGNVSDISAASDGVVLLRDGTALKFDQLKTESYGDETITLAKLADEISPSMALVGRSSNFPVNNETETDIIWNVNASVNPSTMRRMIDHPDKLYARKDGLYRVTLNAQFALSSGGNFRWIKILLNNSDLVAIEEADASGYTSRYFSLSADLPMLDGDYVKAIAWQNSGGQLNVVRNSDRFPNFSLKFLREA